MNSKYCKHVNYCFEGFPLILVSTQKLISEGVFGNVAKAAIGTGLTVGAGLALANPEGFSGAIDSAKTAGQGALNSVKSFGQNAYNTASSWFGDPANTNTAASGSTPQTPANTSNQQTQANPDTNKVVSQPTQPKTNVQPQTPANSNAQQPQPKPAVPASGSTPPTQANAQPTQQKPTESFMNTAKKAAVTAGTMVAAGGIANGAKQAINATTNVMNRPQRDKQQSNQQQTQRVAYA